MSPDASQESSSAHPIFRALRSINEYAASVVLLIYVVGFIVTNLYLGSLGIVNIDVLRVRYVLSGVLFVIFFGCFALPLQGLRTILSTNYRNSPAMKLMRAVRYTFRAFMAVFGVVFLLASLSSAPQRHPIGIPSVSPPLPFSAWTAYARANLPDAAVKLFPFIVYLTLIIVVLAFGPTVVRIITGRLRTLNDVKGEILKVLPNWKRVLWALIGLAGIYAMLIVLTTLQSLIDFVAANRLSFGFQTSGSGSSDLAVGWGRFIIAAFVLYALIAILLVQFSMTSSQPAQNTGGDTTATKGQYFTEYASIVVISTFLVLVIPMYSIGIYPYLPQQIGGGGLVRADVFTSSPVLNAEMRHSARESFIVDRTSAGAVLVMVVDTKQGNYRIFEIPSSQVVGIDYKPGTQ